MKTYTIDNENNISVFASKKEAAAASTTPFDPFTSQEELAELVAAWLASRLVEIWNSIPGVTPITKFTNRKVATDRIWKAIQSLGERPAKTSAVAVPEETVAEEAAPAAENEHQLQQDVTEPAAPQLQAESPETVAAAEPVANLDDPTPHVAPADTESSKKAGRTKKAPKAPKVAKPAKSESGPREGSKTAQVVAMLQRQGGATLAEIMTTMAWQKHTVRGFMAGAMKKAGYAVESFKPEGGERTYRINK
jgi:hypothetical protein